MSELLLIECEGSGLPKRGKSGLADFVGLCKMCGGHLLIEDGKIVPHNRDDIVAMITRGDFDV